MSVQVVISLIHYTHNTEIKVDGKVVVEVSEVGVATSSSKSALALSDDGDAVAWPLVFYGPLRAILELLFFFFVDIHP
jgi:hypothetical protein